MATGNLHRLGLPKTSLQATRNYRLHTATAVAFVLPEQYLSERHAQFTMTQARKVEGMASLDVYQLKQTRCRKSKQIILLPRCGTAS